MTQIDHFAIIKSGRSPQPLASKAHCKTPSHLLSMILRLKLIGELPSVFKVPRATVISLF